MFIQTSLLNQFNLSLPELEMLLAPTFCYREKLFRYTFLELAQKKVFKLEKYYIKDSLGKPKLHVSISVDSKLKDSLVMLPHEEVFFQGIPNDKKIELESYFKNIYVKSGKLGKTKSWVAKSMIKNKVLSAFNPLSSLSVYFLNLKGKNMQRKLKRYLTSQVETTFLKENERKDLLSFYVDPEWNKMLRYLIGSFDQTRIIISGSTGGGVYSGGVIGGLGSFSSGGGTSFGGGSFGGGGAGGSW